MSKHLDSLERDAQKLATLGESYMEAAESLMTILKAIPGGRSTSLAITKLDELDYWAGRAFKDVLEPILTELAQAGRLVVTAEA